jgi:hypothetical protein
MRLEYAIDRIGKTSVADVEKLGATSAQQKARSKPTVADVEKLGATRAQQKARSKQTLHYIIIHH